MKIGFIGLGIMGSRMAANLQKHGHDLVVYNRTREKAQHLIDNGATWADSPADVGEQVDLLITMLAHPEAVEACALGDDGFLHTLEDDALWMDASTVNPSFSRKMADAATTRGIRFLDAPVAGSKGAAENGELMFLIGGDSADVAQVKPLCEIMGRGLNHVGGHGMGTSLKVVVNMMLAASMALFSEGVALGKSLGIDEDTLLNALIGGPVVAPIVGFKRPRIDSDSYGDADFPLQWMHKDVHLANVSAYETGASAAIAATVKELYRQAIDAGYADDDFAAIYAYLTKG